MPVRFCQYQVNILGENVYLLKGYLKYVPLISWRMTPSLISPYCDLRILLSVWIWHRFEAHTDWQTVTYQYEVPYILESNPNSNLIHTQFLAIS